MELVRLTSQGHSLPRFKVLIKKNLFPLDKRRFPVPATTVLLEPERTLGAEVVDHFHRRCEMTGKLARCPRKSLKSFFPLLTLLIPRSRRQEVSERAGQLRYISHS